MTKRFIPLALAAALMAAPGTFAASLPENGSLLSSVNKKDKEKEDRKEDKDEKEDKEKDEKEDSKASKKSDYEKLVKDFTASAEGDFISLHKTSKDKIYIEIPKRHSGKRFLAGGVIKATSNPNIMNLGFKYDDPECLRIEVQDSIILIQQPNDLAYTLDPDLQLAFDRNYIPQTYRRLEIAAWNPDSTSAFFDATSIINSLVPKNRQFKAVKGDDKSTWFGEMKAFEDNASINITQNVELSVTLLGFRIPAGKGTMTSTISFLLLPEEKMKPRIQDSRVGVFSTNKKIDLSSEHDGYKGYHFANRWRIEPVDTAAWMAGEQVEVKKPIVWYVDNSFPEAWKAPIRKGVLAWNAAFEKIGLKNVMQVRDFPTAEEDPEFDPDNLKYSCLRYIPNSTANAMGPSWTDPLTGEILNGTVLVYNDVIRLVNNWRFILTAQVDPRARTQKMPQDLMEESMIYVISHEIGHTLGLMHNMGASWAYPVESLRSATFTQKYGTTPSIMDYARFNYVAQPGDEGLKLVPPSLGVYDEYVIDWLYRPVPQAKDFREEAKIAQKILDEKAGDPFYRYGAQQFSGHTGEYDPRAKVEDLGNDPIKAGSYGISNLQYIMDHLNGWLEDDIDRSYRESLYEEMYYQFHRYIGNTLSQIGGIYLTEVKDGTPGEPISFVDKETQKKSLEWAIREMQQSAWLDNPEVTGRFALHAPASNLVVSANARRLITTLPENILLSQSYAPEDGYTLRDYYTQLFRLVFHGGKLNTQEKSMQRAIVLGLAPSVSKACGTKLYENESELEPLFIENHEISCYDLQSESNLGEGKDPFQERIDVSNINEMTGYDVWLMKKVMKKANKARKFGPAADRAHYEFLYRKAASAIGEEL